MSVEGVSRGAVEGLLPEWMPQDAVILAWPNETMDWSAILPEVQACYQEIILALLGHTSVILLHSGSRASLPSALLEVAESKQHPLWVVEHLPLNDTWMRDVMPLFGQGGGTKEAVDFGFNAWGLKFAAAEDNQASGRLFGAHRLFAPEVCYRDARHYILEGGALESDGTGLVLTTHSVILEPNRNPHRPNPEGSTAEGRLAQQLRLMKELLPRGTKEVWSLDVPPMEGDDTDGHIDTMIRFVSPECILYNDSPEIREALEGFMVASGKAYQLIPLPIPDPIRDEAGELLPATYANFLITNGAVLVPIYGQAKDALALRVVEQAMPTGYQVVGIDCNALIKQHGSLHCITMQVPGGFLSEQLTRKDA